MLLLYFRDEAVVDENMSFDNVICGFALILDEKSKQVYVCYRDDYCHQNSTLYPAKKGTSSSENIIGYMPDFKIIADGNNRPTLQIPEESNYDYREVATQFESDPLRKALKDYHDRISRALG